MSFLLTGGGSQVGSAIAQMLGDADRNVIIGSRSGRVPQGFQSVKLDWADVSTFENPFKIPGVTIGSVYLLSPPGAVDVSGGINQFIDIAVSHGVKRFVLMSGSSIEKEMDFPHSKVWKHLDEKKLDYFVLRPTWFMDNFLRFHAQGIQGLNEFQSTMPTAKIPLISSIDIARVAFEAFLAEQLERTDQRILGPELLTYDQVAEILTEVLGRKITHKVITAEQLIEHHSKPGGFGPELAGFLAHTEQLAEAGAVDNHWGDPENATGKETFKEWAERNKAQFAPSS